MIFLVSESLFEPSAENTTDLLALLRGAAIRGHSLWVVDDPREGQLRESDRFKVWCRELPESLQAEVGFLREALGRLSPQAVTRGAKLVLVWPSPLMEGIDEDDIRLDLNQAIRLVSLPLFILVENAISEGAFLRRLLPAPWRAKIGEWEARGMLCFEHGGGAGEMKRAVESYHSGRARPPWGLGFGAWRSSHFIISDRDTTNAGGLGSNITPLQHACRKYGMSDRFKILVRARQENYLPIEAVLAIVDHRTPMAERDACKREIVAHYRREDTHQESFPASFHTKNAFFVLEDKIAWQDTWFVKDGSTDEMTQLAEQIATLM